MPEQARYRDVPIFNAGLDVRPERHRRPAGLPAEPDRWSPSRSKVRPFVSCVGAVLAIPIPVLAAAARAERDQHGCWRYVLGNRRRRISGSGRAAVPDIWCTSISARSVIIGRHGVVRCRKGARRQRIAEWWQVITWRIRLHVGVGGIVAVERLRRHVR